MDADFQPRWLTTVEHTADTGFVVRAETLAQLFERAAWALFAVITKPDTVRPRESLNIEVAAADREALLVAWLGELLYLSETRRMLFGEFRVGDIGDTRLAGSAAGEPVDPRRHPLYTEVKAVTYHELYVRPVQPGWEARVIVDL